MRDDVTPFLEKLSSLRPAGVCALKVRPGAAHGHSSAASTASESCVMRIHDSEASHKSWNDASIDRGAELMCGTYAGGEWFVYARNWARPGIWPDWQDDGLARRPLELDIRWWNAVRMVIKAPRPSTPLSLDSQTTPSNVYGHGPLDHGNIPTCARHSWIAECQRPKTSTKCYSLSTCFSHNSTHIHSRQLSPAWTARVGFASPHLHAAFRPEEDMILHGSTGDFDHTVSLRARLAKVRSSYYHMLAVLASSQR